MSGRTLNWGILGAGIIAHKLAAAVQACPGNALTAVASNTPGKAEQFAGQYGLWAAPSYQALVESPDVDVVYVANTHNFHFSATELALRAGKHVLVEKPFTVTAAQATALVELAAERGVFLMEALWTRFLPAWQGLRKTLSEGVLGDIHAVQISFCGVASPQYLPRLEAPELAGGVTLDMGIYPLSLVNFALGELPRQVSASGRLNAAGVDELACYQLTYSSGTQAQITTSFKLHAPQMAHFYGTRAFLEFPNFQYGDTFKIHWHAGSREVNRIDIHRFEQPAIGFLPQVQAVHAGITNGARENPLMPLNETIATMALMDTIRGQLGVRYACVGEC